MTADSIFLVAEALRQGKPRRWIDSPRFERPFRGQRSTPTPIEADHPAAMQRAAILHAVECYAPFMGIEPYFSHTTAALMWGLPLPILMDECLHVSTTGRSRRMRGVHGHQIAPKMVRVVAHPVMGWRLTDPATTWAMLGGMLRHPYDLVAVADAIVRVPRVPGPHGRIERDAWGSVADLERAMTTGRRRGVLALREALPRVRGGVASRMETWVRLILVDAGLPEPVTDYDVYDERGEFIGCVDLAYPELLIAIEYEGDQHRTDPRQWQRDIGKHERLADLGWRVIRVPSAQVLGTDGMLVSRVRSAIGARR